jgi:hypothetical protein
MNNLYDKASISLSIFLCLGLVSYAQSVSVMNNIVHHVYDGLVSSENTGLYNGPEFKDQFLDSWDNSHMYLDSSVFMNGTLVYNNQLYTGVPLKYDIYEDNVIIRSNDHLSSFQVELTTENISGFTVHNRDFTKLTGTGSELEGNGFFEVAILGKGASLYIKHVKKRKRETIDNILQYSFLKDNHYVFLYNDAYHIIYDLKDFKQVLPDTYKQIRDFKKQNKRLYKTNPDSFMIALVKYLDENQDL